MLPAMIFSILWYTELADKPNKLRRFMKVESYSRSNVMISNRVNCFFGNINMFLSFLIKNLFLFMNKISYIFYMLHKLCTILLQDLE